MENFSELYQQSLQYLPLLGLGLLAFILMYLLSAPVSQLLIKPLGLLSKSLLVTVVVRRALRVLLILLGLYIFLRLAGLTQFAVAVISGTGVIGLILGFAFKDIAENFIASILLSVQKPFQLGDVIEAQGHTGVIKQVTARATTLVDFDGNHIQIPNATIYKNIIKNFSANPNMRGKFRLGIGYDANVAFAQRCALGVLKSHAAVLGDPEPQVLVDNLGPSTVNLQIYYWVNTHKHSLIKVSSVLMHLVVNEFTRQNISMPDDARELIFPQGLNIYTHKADLDMETLPTRRKTAAAAEMPVADNDEVHADLDTETDDIRQQAANARDPEQGENIL